MAFPRKADGSLDLVAFERLTQEEKKSAITSIRGNPTEFTQVRNHIAASADNLRNSIAENRAVVDNLSRQNEMLLQYRKEIIQNCARDTANELHRESKKSWFRKRA